MDNPTGSRDAEIEQFLDALTRELGFLPATQIHAIRDELAAHLDEMIVQRLWEGLLPDEARRAAIEAFGNPTIHARALRKEWRAWQRRQWSRRLFQDCNERKRVMAGAVSASITAQEVFSFTHSFSTMVDEGKALVPILDTLAAQENNPELKRAIEDICTELQKGNTMSGTMGKYPHIFSSDYVTVIRQGEVAGMLELSLTLLAAVPATYWSKYGMFPQ